MARFVQVQGKADYINVDKIRDFYQTQDKRVIITFDDGETRTIDFSNRGNINYFIEELSGAYTLKQVIPANGELYNVQEIDGDSGEYAADTIKYIGITETGDVYPVWAEDCYYDVIKYGVICSKKQLENFNITYIDDVEKKKILVLDYCGSREVDSKLTEIVARHKGDSQIYIFDSSFDDGLRPILRDYKVEINHQLLEELKRLLGEKSVYVLTKFH